MKVAKPWPEASPEVDALAVEVISRVADKWTLLILEELAERSPLRYTEVSRRLPGISQKMLTQTLRQMERDGLVTRTVHPVIPPHVDYQLTELGLSLGAAFCSVWTWAEENHGRIAKARECFDLRPKPADRVDKPAGR